jgi:hypothetical protein
MTLPDEVFLQSVSNQRLEKPFGVADLLDRMRRVVDAQD